jgi:hypothetical protein
MYKIIEPDISKPMISLDYLKSYMQPLGLDVEYVPVSKSESITDKLVKIQDKLNCTLLEALDVLKYIDERKGVTID